MSSRRNTTGRAERRTATVGAKTTITTPDGDHAVADGFREKQYFKITDSAGTIKHYVITNSVGSGVATGTVLTSASDIGSTTLGSDIANLGVCIAVQIAATGGSPFNQAQVLNELRGAINHANGHNAGTANNNINMSAALSPAAGPQAMTLSNALTSAGKDIVVTTGAPIAYPMWQFNIKTIPGHKNALFSLKQKTVVKSDFTLGHYETESTAANFDMHVTGDRAGGAASVTIEFTGDPTDDRTITLTDTVGDSMAFQFKDDSDVNDGTMTGSNVLVGYSGWGSDAARLATMLVSAIIGSASRHQFKAMVDPSADRQVIITQLMTGPRGNTHVGSNLANATVPSVMTGGSTVAQAPFSSRFQLVRATEASGESVRLSNQKTQG
jgi:hypothetical protein